MPHIDPAALAFWGLIVQGLGVVILIVYTRHTGRQVGALIESNETNRLALAETLRSNEIARDALILSRRAWLNPSIRGNPAAMSAAERFVAVSLNNVGGVPATRVEFGAVATFRPGIEIELPAIDLVPQAPIGVQQEADYFLDIGEIHRSSDLFEKSFHVVGRARYDDGFGNLHSIRFGWHVTGRLRTDWTTNPSIYHLD